MQTFQNNFGFILYAMLFGYYMVAILEDGMKSKESEY